ncbi:MAG: 50S ribosomal protein L1 [Desulfurococcaceae archaeon]
MSTLLKEAFAKAISKAIECGKGRNFKQSVDLVVVLKDVDLKSQQLKIREPVYLPKGRGKELSICVVGDSEMVEIAKNEGARLAILGDDLKNLSKKQAKKIASTCDWLLVKPEFMGLVGRTLGPALGPRGKIPVPVPSSAALRSMIARYKNTVLVSLRNQPQLMVAIGTEDMDPQDLAENALAVVSVVESKLPAGRANIEKIIVKTTMGIPVEVPFKVS